MARSCASCLRPTNERERLRRRLAWRVWGWRAGPLFSMSRSRRRRRYGLLGRNLDVLDKVGLTEYRQSLVALGAGGDCCRRCLFAFGSLEGRRHSKKHLSRATCATSLKPGKRSGGWRDKTVSGRAGRCSWASFASCLVHFCPSSKTGDILQQAQLRLLVSMWQKCTDVHFF